MHRATVPALLLTLALATGCGGSDDPADPADASSPTASGGASPSAPDDASGDPQDGATGIRLTMPHSTVVAPEGWKQGRQLSSGERSAEDPDSISFVSLGEIEAFGSSQGADELGRTRIASNMSPRTPKLLPVTTLDGVPVYHVAGWVTSYRWTEEFGAVRDDRIVTLVFSFDEKVSPEERQQVLDQVLPTFEWR